MKTNELPAPRLQLRWAASERDSRYQWECHYELVLPLGEYDIRREQYDESGDPLPDISELVVAMKEPSLRGSIATPCTVLATGKRIYDDPYRDGSHALWDSKLLGNLPIFVIAPDGMAFARPILETAQGNGSAA